MCKCLRQFLGTNVGVTAFSICCNTEWKRGAWFISAKWTIPEFQEIFPGIDFVSIMYVKYWGFWIYPGPENIGVTQADCVWISLNNSWICLKIVPERICIVFVKRSIADVWRGCNILKVLNIPGIWICKDSGYARVLNINAGSQYARVLYMLGFWIYQASEYARVLNLLGFWIYGAYICFWIEFWY